MLALRTWLVPSDAPLFRRSFDLKNRTVWLSAFSDLRRILMVFRAASFVERSGA